MSTDEEVNRGSLRDELMREAHAGNAGALIALMAGNMGARWVEFCYEKTGDTALHVAARLGRVDVVRALLEADGAAVDCKNKDGKTPLHEACQFGRLDVSMLLLESGADANALRRSDWTPLMLACAKARPRGHDVAELLLRSGALVDYANKDGWSALHLACREGDVALVRLFREAHNADVVKTTRNKRSVLHIAALHGRVAVVKYLLPAFDGGVDLRDSCGNTPLHEAACGGCRETCQLLIEGGANLALVNGGGFGPLHLAAGEGHSHLVKYFASDLGLDVNCQSRDGYAPLHCAARRGRGECFDLLVELGADASVCDALGRRPADYCGAG